MKQELPEFTNEGKIWFCGDQTGCVHFIHGILYRDARDVLVEEVTGTGLDAVHFQL